MLIFLPGVYQEILAAPLEVSLSVIYLGVFQQYSRILHWPILYLVLVLLKQQVLYI